MKQLFSQNGTPVDRFAFGTMQFGGKADRAESQVLYAEISALGPTPPPATDRSEDQV